MINTFGLILSILLTFLVSVLLGYFFRVKQHDKSLKEARAEVEKIIENGKKEGSRLKKESILETKQEIFQLKKENENDLKERRQVVITLENKASQREDALNNRSVYLDKREESISNKEQKLEQRR